MLFSDIMLLKMAQRKLLQTQIHAIFNVIHQTYYA